MVNPQLYVPARYSNRFSSNPFPLEGLKFYADLWNVEQQGFLLSYDGNDKLAATAAQLRPLDSSGTYEITGFRSSSTANDQTLIASCDTGTTTTFFHIYVAATTGRLTISTRENNGTVNTVSGTTNVCSGARIPTMQVKSSGTAWSFVINGVLDTPIVVAGANTGDWLADIGLVAPRDNITHGVKTTTGDGSWAIAEMGQHRLYSVAISDAECATNNSRGWKATPFDSTYVVYNLPCTEGTGNPVETVAAVNPTLTGATWIEGLTDRSPNAYALTLFGSPVWGNKGRTFDATNDYISVPASTPINDLSAYSFEAWIKPTGWGESNTSYIGSKGSKVFLYWATTDGRVYTFHGFSGTFGRWYIPSGSISLNNWYHLVVTYNNTSVANDPIIYLNATTPLVTENSTPVGTASTDNASNLFIGGDGAGAQTFGGIIGENRYYNRILIASEVQQSYLAGLGSGRYNA